jgi:hypothetical protein
MFDLNTRGQWNVSYPEHVCILQVCLRVTLLGVDKVRELGGISDEEHRCVIEHPVQVSFFSSQFDGETTRIAGSVGRTIFTANRGETDSCSNFLANIRE